MRKGLIKILLASLLLAASSLGFAADNTKDADAAADKDAKSAKKDEKPIPPEKTSVSHGSVEVGGRTIHYTATAGTVLIRDDKDNKPDASVFYVAYTVERGRHDADRPITFLYNGGPGSSSVWLHMGSVAPVRVESASADATAPPPYRLAPNPDSLIDKTDLVFIDAVGTGFSTPAGKGEGKDFWGIDQDLHAFAKAITRYVTLNQRWNSPKFLFGESYGTTRSAALVNVLQGQGMAFNGVVLLSSILNYGAEFTRPRPELYRRPADLRRDRVVPRQGTEQAGRSPCVSRRGAHVRDRRVCGGARERPEPVGRPTSMRSRPGSVATQACRRSI